MPNGDGPAHDRYEGYPEQSLCDQVKAVSDERDALRLEVTRLRKQQVILEHGIRKMRGLLADKAVGG